MPLSISIIVSFILVIHLGVKQNLSWVQLPGLPALGRLTLASFLC